ncbi:hypothetical protein PR202_gb11139 [Eleusine coracana subsp. coracana]|uniref:Uncharacterized protein n=1 Tax=Eleusine coracana subsp. coracana TaxID=191504 RepID=A0AAV5EJG3_ELECO|nr:hypothetical protein PR202_gb11139 [Eleusine coracana subsp. coracana]
MTTPPLSSARGPRQICPAALCLIERAQVWWRRWRRKRSAPARAGPRRSSSPPFPSLAAALWHAQAPVARLCHASSSRGLASTPASAVRGPSPRLPASLRRLELPPRPPLRQPPSRARCRRVRSRCRIRLPARTRLPALARLHLSWPTHRNASEERG